MSNTTGLYFSTLDLNRVEAILIESGGEFTDEIIQVLDLAEKNFTNELEKLAHIIKVIEARAAGVASLKKYYSEKETKLKSTVETLKENIKKQIIKAGKNGETIKGPTFSFYLKQTVALNTENVSVENLPKRFVRKTEAVFADKDKLKKWLLEKKKFVEEIKDETLRKHQLERLNKIAQGAVLNFNLSLVII